MTQSMRWIVALIFIAAISPSARVFSQTADGSAPRTTPRRVAVMLFPGVELLDFAGPSEVFAGSRDESGNSYFDVYTVGLSKSPIKSQRFLTVTPQFDPGDAPLPDILVIPGGNVIPLMDDAAAMAFVEKVRDEKRLILSVCNGASVLAKVGALDGLEVTTHHSNLEILRQLAPKATVHANRRYVDNGEIITTAGVSAGIDGALYLVSRLHGKDAANRCAIYMNYDHWVGLPTETLSSTNEPLHSKSRQGRVYPAEEYAVLKLLSELREGKFEELVKQYPQRLAGTKGHDREMIEEAGLRETALWLLRSSREKESGIRLLRFAAETNPKSAQAAFELAKALVDADRRDEAKVAMDKAISLDPKNEQFIKARQELRE